MRKVVVVMGLFGRKREDGTPVAGELCPACGTKGVVDYVDLVHRSSSRHCPRCTTLWVHQVDAVAAGR